MINKSSQLVNSLQEQSNLTSIELPPFLNINPVIQPTIQLKPKFSYGNGTGSIVSGTVTVMTIDSTKNFFLTDVLYSFVKDAICDISTGSMSITGTINVVNKTTYIVPIAVLTLTAQSESKHIRFNYPLELTKGSVIQFNATYGAGIMARYITVYGFYL